MPTVACPKCSSVNRVPQERLTDNPSCGRCGAALFEGRPVTLTAASFDRHADADLPLLVDFWAGWCGPCKMMAPQFEAAARSLEPQFRLGKLDTEAEQQIREHLGAKLVDSTMAAVLPVAVADIAAPAIATTLSNAGDMARAERAVESINRTGPQSKPWVRS